MEEFVELVLRAKNKDSNAFSELVQLVQNDLYRIGNARLDNINDINDAMQETIIIAYKSIKKLENNQFFKTWIIRIMINECNKIYKHNNRRLLLFNKLLVKNTEEEYDNNIEKTENRLELEQLFKLLNYNERICITLFYNSNYSAQEIAKILGTNEKTIKSRIVRAKQKIRNHYNGGVEHEAAKK